MAFIDREQFIAPAGAHLSADDGVFSGRGRQQ
jgi:hypothetical protein